MRSDLSSFAAAGATWWLADFDPHAVTVDEVRAVIRAGTFSSDKVETPVEG